MHLTLRLIGPVTLLDANGDDLTPRGRKARGALAMLGMAPGLRLGRARLQDRLWSDSPQAQGAASLRQTLRELRRALRDHQSVLLSGDGWVGLDPARLTVDLRPLAAGACEAPEFAEGLDIADAEFEDWLRDTRLALEDRPRAQVLPLLVLSDPVADTPSSRMLAVAVVQQAASHAASLLPAQVLPLHSAPASSPGLLVEAMCLQQPGPEMLLMISLRDLSSGAQLWAQQFPLSQSTPALHRAISALALTLIQTVGQLRLPGRLFPLTDLFSFSRSRLLSADRVLTDTDSPVAQSLRAFLRYTLIIERQTPDQRATLAEAEALASRARERAPADPIVLSVSALMRSWQGQVAGALDLARDACRLAPGHDLAHLVLSQALTDAGRDSEALSVLIRARGGPLAMLGQPSWRLRQAAALIRLGRYAEAENSAAAALSHSTECRPALRFLAALRHHRRDEEGAAAALNALRRIEPDFAPELMASPDYPVSTLRRAGLLAVARARL